MQIAATSRRKKRIKAVFFDFDGVLTRDSTGSITTLRYLSNATGIALERLEDAFREHNVALNLGRTTHSAIWPSVCEMLNRELDIALLTAAFESTPLNVRMFELARSLRKTCATGIITDNKRDRMDHLTSFAKLKEVFDPIVVSAEVGYDKRTPYIFEHALAMLAIEPEESVFIDNTRTNLQTADALGMNTIYFDHDKNDIPNLTSILERGYGLELQRRPT